MSTIWVKNDSYLDRDGVHHVGSHDSFSGLLRLRDADLPFVVDLL